MDASNIGRAVASLAGTFGLVARDRVTGKPQITTLGILAALAAAGGAYYLATRRR
jgi:hypothetical protein